MAITTTHTTALDSSHALEESQVNVTAPPVTSLNAVLMAVLYTILPLTPVCGQTKLNAELKARQHHNHHPARLPPPLRELLLQLRKQLLKNYPDVHDLVIPAILKNV